MLLSYVVFFTTLHRVIVTWRPSSFAAPPKQSNDVCRVAAKDEGLCRFKLLRAEFLSLLGFFCFLHVFSPKVFLVGYTERGVTDAVAVKFRSVTKNS